MRSSIAVARTAGYAPRDGLGRETVHGPLAFTVKRGVHAVRHAPAHSIEFNAYDPLDNARMAACGNRHRLPRATLRPGPSIAPSAPPCRRTRWRPRTALYGRHNRALPGRIGASSHAQRRSPWNGRPPAIIDAEAAQRRLEAQQAALALELEASSVAWRKCRSPRRCSQDEILQNATRGRRRPDRAASNVHQEPAAEENATACTSLQMTWMGFRKPAPLAVISHVS